MSSGGHIESIQGIGGKSAIEWVQTYDGTWKTVETSEKGDSYDVQHGDRRERELRRRDAEHDRLGAAAPADRGREREHHRVRARAEPRHHGPHLGPAALVLHGIRAEPRPR